MDNLLENAAVQSAAVDTALSRGQALRQQKDEESDNEKASFEARVMQSVYS